MNFLKILVLSVFLVAGINPARSNPKVQQIGLNALYGTVGGSLLGISALAFGASGRSVAKGASLGLYLGLIFGVYVVASYSYGQRGDFQRDEGSYFDRGSYQPDNSSGGLFDFGKDSGRANYMPEIENNYRGIQSLLKRDKVPPLKVNLFQYKF